MGSLTHSKDSHTEMGATRCHTPAIPCPVAPISNGQPGPQHRLPYGDGSYDLPTNRFPLCAGVCLHPASVQCRPMADQWMKLADVTPSKVTPMLRQFIEAKADSGDSLLFFRMGDFYELF